MINVSLQSVIHAFRFPDPKEGIKTARCRFSDSGHDFRNLVLACLTGYNQKDLSISGLRLYQEIPRLRPE
jgi:hypothetical protein